MRDQLEQEVTALLQQNRKLDAVKRTREVMGYGLANALRWVEEVAARDQSAGPSQGIVIHLMGQPVASGEPKAAAEARALVLQGLKINAIKLLRAHNGWSLLQAKAWVDAVADGAQPSSDMESFTAVGTEQPMDTEALNAEIRRCLAEGRKIDAVRHAMNQLKVGLAVAKDYVEALDGRRPPDARGPESVAVPAPRSALPQPSAQPIRRETPLPAAQDTSAKRPWWKFW